MNQSVLGLRSPQLPQNENVPGRCGDVSLEIEHSRFSFHRVGQTDPPSRISQSSC